MPVSWDDISTAFEFVSSDMGGHSAFVCRRTGAIFLHSELGGAVEELPEDIESADYIALPEPRDLDLGSRLVMRFADDVLPAHAGTITGIFSRKGAFRRFKSFLARVGALDKWDEYEVTATEKALREWCTENGLEVEG